MKNVLHTLADVLDALAVLGALGGLWFFLANFTSIETGPELIQIALVSTMLAVVPYCLAGAVHRIWSRL